MIPPVRPRVFTNVAKKLQNGTDFVSIKAAKKGLDKFTSAATKDSKELAGFAKLYDVLTDKIAFTIGKIAPTKPADSIIKGLQHFKKPTPRMADLASIIYTIKLMTDTSKSKKIEKERKPALIINSALVTAASSTLAMVVDNVTDPILKEMGSRYAKLDPATFKKAEASIKSQSKLAEEWLSNADFAKGLSKFKSLSIFTLLVRILVPILSIPITGKITEWFVNRGKEKEQQEQKELAKA
ncbi:hypothetical protein IJC60_00730 [bacterium]|nr:hypothetical protein [bacterium]